MYTLNSTEVHAVCYGIDLYNQTMTGGLAVHQNGSGEVQMSEVGYTVSTNSNASGRNTPIVLVLNDQGGA